VLIDARHRERIIGRGGGACINKRLFADTARSHLRGHVVREILDARRRGLLIQPPRFLVGVHADAAQLPRGVTDREALRSRSER
jgi:hypothetical protein